MVLLTRAPLDELEKWKRHMQAQMWWWTRRPLVKDNAGNYIKEGIDENGRQLYRRGNEEVTKVSGVLRPIQLWEYVLPTEGARMTPQGLVKSNNIQEAMAMMNIHKNEPIRPEISNFAWMLRKAMKLKKFEKMPEEMAKQDRYQLTDRFIPMEAMGVYPIGIKEDVTQDMIFPGTGEAYYQEGL